MLAHIIPTLGPTLVEAGLCPDCIGPYHHTITLQAPLTDQMVWDESAMKASEERPARWK